jgi:hypothetical protein
MNAQAPFLRNELMLVSQRSRRLSDAKRISTISKLTVQHEAACWASRIVRHVGKSLDLDPLSMQDLFPLLIHNFSH